MRSAQGQRTLPKSDLTFATTFDCELAFVFWKRTTSETPHDCRGNLKSFVHAAPVQRLASRYWGNVSQQLNKQFETKIDMRAKKRVEAKFRIYQNWIKRLRVIRGVYVKPRHAKPTIHGYCKKVLCADPAEKTNKPRAIQSTICSVRLCQLSSAQHRPFQFSTGKH